MTLDEELLQKAQESGRQLAESERRALLARAEYHTAVRRLHLAGASLREIGQALALSHQRVQQIVDAAGGSWWRRVWGNRNVKRDAVCSFCGHPPSEVAKLIAGPNVFICDGCVAGAERALDGFVRGAGRFTLAEARGKARCAFCGKKHPLLASAGDDNVCAECLRLCRDILGARG
jgi:hypothetical protein